MQLYSYFLNKTQHACGGFLFYFLGMAIFVWLWKKVGGLGG